MKDRDRIEKLLRLHKSVPNTPEGKNAYAHAKRLMAKNGWTEADFKPKPQPREAPRVWVMDPVTSLLTGLKRPPRKFEEELSDAVKGLKDLFS